VLGLLAVGRNWFRVGRGRGEEARLPFAEELGEKRLSRVEQPSSVPVSGVVVSVVSIVVTRAEDFIPFADDEGDNAGSSLADLGVGFVEDLVLPDSSLPDFLDVAIVFDGAFVGAAVGVVVSAVGVATTSVSAVVAASVEVAVVSAVAVVTTAAVVVAGAGVAAVVTAAAVVVAGAVVAAVVGVVAGVTGEELGVF